MTARENICARLDALLERGSLPRSECSGSLLQALKPLIQGSVVVEERSRAGRRLVVRDVAALRAFRRIEFPESGTPGNASARVTGVARFRDSKALANDTPEIVCVRCFASGVLRRDGKDAEAALATERNGVFSFALGETPAWSLHGTCALVENPAVFLAVESLGLAVTLAIHGRGRGSNRLLDWLGAQTDGAFQLWHLPDYDPTGLDEFERVRARLGSRARLHLPTQLPELFRRFSKRELLANSPSQSLLTRLRTSDSSEVRQVVHLISEHNAGLEQEALLLASETKSQIEDANHGP